MSFHIEDLPAVEAAGPLGRSLPSGSPLLDAYHDASKPSVATQVASLGVALGLDAVRALQDRLLPTRGDLVAMSHGGAAPSYSTWPDCTIYGATDGCNAPCVGFPLDQMATWYCATCAEQAADPTHNPPWNWHFTGSRGSIQYGDLANNICNTRDAWKWTIQGACRGCSERIVFRCHDGWKKYDPNGPITPTICEGVISCDNQLTLCP